MTIHLDVQKRPCGGVIVDSRYYETELEAERSALKPARSAARQIDRILNKHLEGRRYRIDVGRSDDETLWSPVGWSPDKDQARHFMQSCLMGGKISYARVFDRVTRKTVFTGAKNELGN